MYNAANNASSQLAQAISAADTSLTVLDGSSFPDAPFLVTIEDEIIEVGAKDGNTFSALVRGTEGTTPASHASGSRVENRFTAGTYQQIVDKINNLKAEEIEYTSEVTSFAPTQVAAALDALAGVRIVEMGSNANGEYVRWENGLQVCWIDEAVASFYDRYVLRYHWVYPAGFATPPAVESTKYSPYEFNGTDVPDGELIRNLKGPYLRQRSGVFVRLDLANSLGDWIDAEDSLKLSAFAIGRWK